MAIIASVYQLVSAVRQDNVNTVASELARLLKVIRIEQVADQTGIMCFTEMFLCRHATELNSRTTVLDRHADLLPRPILGNKTGTWNFRGKLHARREHGFGRSSQIRGLNDLASANLICNKADQA
ncbi:MAG TPA: hypothetical protein P5569_01995 [Candidatus Latescibacteria bacterium]|nr:hypothetical protein [Candidatus Latescibacterota bacterium]